VEHEYTDATTHQDYYEHATKKTFERKRQNSEENLAERSSVGYADEKSLPDEECFMNCPHCASMATREQSKRTCLGYRIFRCSACQRTFNERTATPFNFLEYPTDIVLLVVLWRLRYKLSLRDLAEMFLERGWEFTHETVRDWEARFAPLLADQWRTKRRGQASQSWYVDETYGHACMGSGVICTAPSIVMGTWLTRC
jgi:transposase-like protein